MDTTKICRVCQEQKSLLDFNKDASKKDGHQTICRPCKHSKDKEYSAQRKDIVNERSRKWRKEK
jgi:protein-arginine kinase activator protein McsA